MSKEDLQLDAGQQAAYDAADVGLRSPIAAFLAPPVPSLVQLTTDIDVDETGPRSLIAPNSGHHELARVLDELEGSEKEESSLLERADLTSTLTSILTGNPPVDPRSSLSSLEVLGRAVPRRVCQHPFRKNDIVWVCRTCQADETCVLCHACFSLSNHDGHDVAFYHAQAGGCCDCGDPDAWDPAGFCPYHGPDAQQRSDDTSHALPANLVNRVRGIVPSCVDWVVEQVAATAEVAYRRANPRPVSRRARSSEDEAASPMDTSRDLHSSQSMPMPDAEDVFEDAAEELSDILFGPAFDPSAASADREMREVSHDDARALELGQLGAENEGLYIVLFADDIHSSAHLFKALRDFFGATVFYTDKLLGTLVRVLRQYGHLVVWGTMEMAADCGATQVHLWLDGDSVAATRIGAVALERASRLTKHGLFCSIATGKELKVEQRAVYVLQWLSAVARSCDPLCQTVAECILPNRHLVPLLRADFKMSARVTKAWYSLLLTLLAVPTFKSHLAAAYCDTYRNVTAKYARGMGVLERSGYTLSVQFLNRVTYVVDLVKRRDLLGKLGKAILETLLVASEPDHLYGRLDPNHSVLTHRRYSPCVSDLKCVLNVKGMPRIIACEGASFLDDWIASLSLAQLMDPHVWRHWTLGHVESESRGWVGAFNASISLGSLFERLLGWADEDTSPIDDPSSPYARGLLPCVEMTFRILRTGVDRWQKSEMVSYEPTLYTAEVEKYKRCPCSLPFSTVAASRDAACAMRQMPVSQVTPFSFHLPLHRFVASCLRELCIRTDDEAFGVAALARLLRERLPNNDYDGLYLGLMEFPLLVLSRATQVRGGMWRRNGNGLNDQVLNYAEPPFCRTMRDADLLMVQFAVMGRVHNLSPRSRPSSDVGMSFFVNLLIHRLGLFDFLGLAKAPSRDIPRYMTESENGLYPREVKGNGDTDDELPWTYAPSRDAASSFVLMEEFLHLIIMFTSELPLPPPTDRADHTKQAKWKLFREVVHRLASGPKTHSELSEVQHVLSHWDNTLLSEEGKLINPDDATGAALGTVLSEMAERKVSRGKLEPDKWEMQRSAWDSYDPAFYHISLRNHQTAAENRPKPKADEQAMFGWEPRAYAPKPYVAHSYFSRLRRDSTADATVLAATYRVLHLHCRQNVDRDLSNLLGKAAYECSEKSETAVARALHILTLGAYAWSDTASRDDLQWREKGGGSAGSIFFDRADSEPAPTAADWIEATLLVEPKRLLDCDWYDGEDKLLLLLQRLATKGGLSGGFMAQDPSVRSGAAWLCDFAVKFSSRAEDLVAPKKAVAATADGGEEESEFDRRKRLAKENRMKEMAKMKAQAAKFASMMEVDLGDSEDEAATQDGGTAAAPSTPHTPVTRMNSVGSSAESSAGSSVMSGSFSERSGPLVPFSADIGVAEHDVIPPRLLRVRPLCIICNYEESTDTRKSENEAGEGQRKRSRRKTENALGFVGYAQPSTVLKGGGGPPQDPSSPFSTVGDFVGTHVALCGHAVHSECCESYLTTVLHREDRLIGKRDEFRCPLCQRLSNCLVPFIDVGVDWIESPTGSNDGQGKAKTDIESESPMDIDSPSKGSLSLHDFLSGTPWWVTNQNGNVVWDGQSAFIDRTLELSSSESNEEQAGLRKPARRRPVRSLKKKDLYAAWSAMMRTPRFVRRKLRPRSSSGLRDSSVSISRVQELTLSTPEATESAGETLVWRRFMDQLSDISYRADSKRLGDERLHLVFGEFRHYVVEKYAYNMGNQYMGTSPVDWPSCLFAETLPDSKRQEMSREKLLSKLLLSIQSFTYSCCCESFEARRNYRKSFAASPREATAQRQDTTTDAVLSKFGFSDLVCGGKLVVLPKPTSEPDDGFQPFDGRLGKLRYLALAIMAAAGAVAADLVQIVLPFPLKSRPASEGDMETEGPLRAPVAYPILLGHVLTHVVAAMCASSGRARARSDALDLAWPAPFSSRGSFVFSNEFLGAKNVDSVMEDCEGFLKLGLLARMLQVLLGRLKIPSSSVDNPRAIMAALNNVCGLLQNEAPSEMAWIRTCYKLLEVALTNGADDTEEGLVPYPAPGIEEFGNACMAAAIAATAFLSDAGVILQILVPGVMAKYQNGGDETATTNRSKDAPSALLSFEAMRTFFKFETIAEMLQSPAVCETVANWYDAACRHSKAAVSVDDSDSETTVALRRRLFATQGFRHYDWPSAGVGSGAYVDGKVPPGAKNATEQPEDDISAAPMHIETGSGASLGNQLSTTAEMLRSQATPSLVTFSSKKTVPLLGGVPPDTFVKAGNRPRVAVIPTSYTDLYAELGSLLRDCEQTAVCLICGEVLNAGGKGECTRHSYKCGAGAGMFFLLQECSGLIMHKSKAAYIHSPYVDSHGETPQFRGRPLNLDLVRYEHLREIWMGHAVRQTVVAERGSSKQVILHDFY